MKELPDDELDKLFKKSAEELDSTFDPQDWNSLRKKLDRADGKTEGAWWKKWWPAGLLTLLMLGGLGSYLFINRVKKPETTFAAKNVLQIPADITPKIKNDQINDDKVIEKKAGQDLEEQSKSTSEVERKGPFGEDKGLETGKRVRENSLSEATGRKEIIKTKSKKILPRRWSKTGGVYLGPNRSIGRRDDGAFNANKNAVKSSKIEVGDGKVGGGEMLGESKNWGLEVVHAEGFQVRKSAEADITPALVVPAEVPVGSDAVAADKRLLIAVDLLQSRAMLWNKTNTFPKVKLAETPVAEPVKVTENDEPSPKFAVRFGYSPDLSVVGLKNFSKPGTAVSLLIEYALFRKLYIQTGVARSSKVYNAQAGTYEWPASWNDQKVLPTSVDGVCKIIEIPLNLRYDITQTERSRWFAGAGASSYYMQNEKYDYNYPKHTYGIKWPNYETSTGWYWLSHLNASVGYEYRLSKKLSLMAEPYVRIPVKKVGFGKVDLFTFGTWFSIRYTPVFK